MPSGPLRAPNTHHLTIALTSNYVREGVPKVLVVTATTVRQTKVLDSTCILNQGDHEFLKSASFIVYAWALILDVSRIKKGFKSQGWRPMAPLERGVLERVVAGLQDSSRAPIKTKLFFYDWNHR